MRAAKQLPAYDVHCPLGSLPLALKTEPATIPADIPYLHADKIRIAKWRPRLDGLPGKRVALAWAGNVSHANDRNRSIDLALLEPLLALEGVSFLSIQRELRGDDAELLARHVNVTPSRRRFGRHGRHGGASPHSPISRFQSIRRWCILPARLDVRSG